MGEPSMTGESAGPTSRFYMSDGLRLHYVDWGSPEAPPLLLLHGGEDHARSWDRLARSLRSRWRVVCPDLRGHGDSAWSPDGAYMMPYLVSDLARLVEEMSPTGPVTIIAHSLGGAIALYFAGAMPERVTRLVAMEGLGLSPDKWREQGEEAAPARWRDWIDHRRRTAARPPRRYETIEQAAERMRARNPHLTPALADQLTAHGMRADPAGGWRWKFDPRVRGWPPIFTTEQGLQAIWAAITCPVLLCHGADSWASNPAADGRAAWFRDASVISFADAGHWMHHDQPEAFARALDDFLLGPES